MAESLYVCLFSNGHIKVGRSIDPESRIACHADRVACMGVELSDRFVVECVGPASPREARLISRCAESATSRYLNEWFVGLDYLDVCDWATEAAQIDLTEPEAASVVETFGTRLACSRRAKGLTQSDLGRGLGQHGQDVNKAVVSGWELGQHHPKADQLQLICTRLEASADWLLFGVTHQERV